MSTIPAGARAWAWGDNAFGQLGDGTTTHRGTPQPVTDLDDVVSVAGGGGHATALKSDGTVWAWGRNDFGQCGVGHNEDLSTPSQVKELDDVTELVGGGGHTLAVRSDGTIWAWGHNQRGDCGDGTTDNRNVPTQVVGVTDISSAGWGGGHGLALLRDGTVRSWGHNLFGALGDGTTTTRPTAIAVKGIESVVFLTGGGGHTVALTADGSYWAWGRNDRGQLGDGTTESRLTPTRIELFDNGLRVVDVSAGFFHTMIRTEDGRIWTFGNNDSGQLGDGTTNNLSRPHEITGLGEVSVLAAGGGRNEFGPGGHSVVLLADGTLRAWGLNDAGQLGDGSTENCTAPVPVAGLHDVRRVVALGGFNLAVA